MITIFKNIRETSTPFHKELMFVLDRIKEGKHKGLIESIRSEGDKSKRNDLKKNLPAICFSGTFSKRSDDSIIKHSGFICLDFDGYETPELMDSEKSTLINDKYVLSVFVSPSGNGLKAIVKIPSDPSNHKRYFDALQSYYNSKYFDVTSKNISRVCYESYDSDIHIKEDSEIWDDLGEHLSIVKDQSRPTVPITDENKIIEILVKWWSKKYPMIDGQRNNNAFILASALNEYGINKSIAVYVLGQYASKGFSQNEINATIESAYRDTASHSTKYYEDDSVMSKIRTSVNKGSSSEQIKSDFSRLNLPTEVLESVIVDIEKDSSIKKFWNKSDKGAISIVHYLYKEFLQREGFYKYSYHGSDKYMFVKVTNNLIDKASEEQVKDFVLGYLEGFDDLTVYNFFADKTRFFKEDFLSLLDTVDVHFVEDTKMFSYIYFRNSVVKVYSDKVDTVDYVDLDGYVWRDQVIDRDFAFCDVTDCDFKKFIRNISGDKEDRVRSLESSMGFLMSGYKDPGFCPSVILNDEVITDNPEGGTGKGLFVQGISMMKKVAMIDGKAFSFDKPFAYQTINTDTQVISFDDVKKAFEFERLFSAITEGITIEKKNKDAIRIPFKFSPKIVITTNYTIRGRGNSFNRRKFEVELKQYYTKDFTPVDDFGKRLFDEWNDDEWCSFDNYMINTLQRYLYTGLIEAESSNTQIKKLAADTCHEFVEWLGLLKGAKTHPLIVYDKRIFMDNLYTEFITDNPDFDRNGKRTISRTAFYKWLMYYGHYDSNCMDTNTDRATQGKWIMYISNQDEKKEDKQKVIPGLEF